MYADREREAQDAEPQPYDYADEERGKVSGQVEARSGRAGKPEEGGSYHDIDLREKQRQAGCSLLLPFCFLLWLAS